MRRIHKLDFDMCMDCGERPRSTQFEKRKYEGDGILSAVEIVNDRTKRCQGCYELFAVEEFKRKEERERQEKQRMKAAALRKKKELVEMGHAHGGDLCKVDESGVSCAPCGSAITLGVQCTSGVVFYEDAARRLYWCVDCIPLQT